MSFEFVVYVIFSIRKNKKVKKVVQGIQTCILILLPLRLSYEGVNELKALLN